MKLAFHPEAEDTRFCERRSKGLGLDFLSAVEGTIARIRKFPDAGPIERARTRRRLAPGFPFTVLYEVQRDRILIGAVMHQHRRPGYWVERFGD